MSNEFQVPEVVRVYRVSDLKAEYIVSGYRSVIDPAKIPEWEERASSIKVTSDEEIEKMAAARELRLMIRQSRIAAESKRKELKEAALQESKAIDGLGRAIRERLESVEEHLKAQEEFAKRMEEERERARREEADRLLREKEEREAREREAARVAEEKRLREENARLRKEAEEKAAAQEAERQLLAEQRAREEAERRAAEEQARKEREAERDRERREYEAKLKAERERAELMAATVRCPECGHTFDSREHRAEEAQA